MLLSFLAIGYELYNFAASDARHHSETSGVGRTPLRFITLAHCEDVERAHHLNQILITHPIRKYSAHERTQRLLDGFEQRGTFIVNDRPKTQVLPLG